jgi:hypothetical protein
VPKALTASSTAGAPRTASGPQAANGSSKVRAETAWSVPADLAEFRDRLHGLLDEYARRPQDPGAQKWSPYLGMHPEA